jgi:sulfite exporter TauE/SafE
MYIVAIGWLYVVVLMALSEETLLSGAVTLLLFGALPIGMLLIVRNGSKRSRRLRREAIREASSSEDGPADDGRGQ